MELPPKKTGFSEGTIFFRVWYSTTRKSPAPVQKACRCAQNVSTGNCRFYSYAGHTEFYQPPSTLRLRYDRAKGDFDYFTYCGKEVGKEIGDDALFTVGLQNYHFKNIESFFNISYDTICKLQKPRSVATSCQDILMEYFREHEMLDAAVDGRMTILAPDGTAR